MIHLIKDENNRNIGWEIKPVTEEEQLIAGSIRDLQFFGFGDTAIKYDGLKLIDEDKGKVMGNIKSLTFLQKKHCK